MNAATHNRLVHDAIPTLFDPPSQSQNRKSQTEEGKMQGADCDASSTASRLMPSSWGTDRVHQWLQEIGLGSLQPEFEEQKIDGEALLHLTAMMIAHLAPTVKAQITLTRELSKLKESAESDCSIDPPAPPLPSSQDAASLAQEAADVSTKSEWPIPYKLPVFSPSLAMSLKNKSPALVRRQRSKPRNQLIQSLYDQMTKYTLYPTHSQYHDVCSSVVQQYPFLQDASPSGYHFIKLALVNKFKNERHPLTSVNEVKNSKANFGAPKRGRNKQFAVPESESEDPPLEHLVTSKKILVLVDKKRFPEFENDTKISKRLKPDCGVALREDEETESSPADVQQPKTDMSAEPSEIRQNDEQGLGQNEGDIFGGFLEIKPETDVNCDAGFEYPFIESLLPEGEIKEEPEDTEGDSHCLEEGVKDEPLEEETGAIISEEKQGEKGEEEEREVRPATGATAAEATPTALIVSNDYARKMEHEVELLQALVKSLQSEVSRVNKERDDWKMQAAQLLQTSSKEIAQTRSLEKEICKLKNDVSSLAQITVALAGERDACKEELQSFKLAMGVGDVRVLQ